LLNCPSICSSAKFLKKTCVQCCAVGVFQLKIGGKGMRLNMDNCIFCKIIKGELPSYTIYEDDIVKAFLDIEPFSDGHILIIPKKHFENMYDIDVETLKNIEDISRKIGKLLKEKLNCVGITRLQNNEYGQAVKHYHMHIIPRYKNDKLNFSLNLEKKLPEEIFEKIIK